MIKYDYTGAAALWNKYYNLCIDDMSFCGQEKQQERRYFMRAVTRHIDIKLYIDFIYELIDSARPLEDQKSRVYDFEYERALEALIWEIKTFYKKGARNDHSITK